MITQKDSIDKNNPPVLCIVDTLIISVLIIASVIFIPFLHSHSRDSVEVYKIDDVIARYPLDEDRIFSVVGVNGMLEVEIKEERVRVISSSCPHQICVDTGWISRAYEQIICAPNRVFISVKSDPGKEDIDAVSR
ncbi:NusG domain II-containing protein [Thermodesulfobacteriota bacterium]